MIAHPSLLGARALRRLFVLATLSAPVLLLPQATQDGQDSATTGADSTQLELRALTAQLEAERRASRARQSELEGRIVELEAALQREQQLRLDRETEWLEFTRLLVSFELPDLPAPPEFIEERLVEPPDPDAERRAAEAAARRARAAELMRQLDALLLAEQITTLDFLELGEPHLHRDRGVVGPVVARLVDDRGRLVGMLAAERFWLEVSRAGHSVTLVFDEGYETRRGVRMPFASGSPDASPDVNVEPTKVAAGTRRIFLPTVDPAPWIDALPELVAEDDLAPRSDDGRWNLPLVRLRLNEELRVAAQGLERGWRVRVVGGVVGNLMRDVQLAEIDAEGRVLRRLFADRMTVIPRTRGVELLLEDGSQDRAGRVAPFLDGRFRIVLPRADVERWRKAGVPGL